MTAVLDDITIVDTVSAGTLEIGDQIVIQGDLFIVHTIDTDRVDVDEVFVTGENLSGDDSSFALFADDLFDIWTV